MQRAETEDDGHAKTIGRREIVPGVSSLTICDELREARNEIKRVPENSRGSARSNYLREVRSVKTDCWSRHFFLRLSLISLSDRLSPFHFLRRICRAMRIRDGQAEEIILDYILFFCARLWRAISGERGAKREDNETWNSRNPIRRINYNAKDPRGARRTAGRNLISLANEFLSKSRVSCLM